MREGKPTLLAAQNLNVGAVFAMGYCRWVGGWGWRGGGGKVWPCQAALCSAQQAAPRAQPAIHTETNHGRAGRQLPGVLSMPGLKDSPLPRLALLVRCCRDAPLILAAGGAAGTVSVWDTMSASAVAAYVQQHAPEVAVAAAGGGGEAASAEP